MLHPVNRLDSFRPSSPYQAGQPENLPFPYAEANVFEIAHPRQFLYPQDFFPDFHFRLWIHIADFTPYHRLNQIRISNTVHIITSNILGIPKNGNPRGQTVHIFKPMGNENNGSPAVS